MRIDCPCCGPRSLHEFTYGGDATRVRPAMEETASGPWEAYVYDRANPRGRHEELWHHVGGCRHWLKVARDTATHEIFTVSLLGPYSLPQVKEEAGRQADIKPVVAEQKAAKPKAPKKAANKTKAERQAAESKQSAQGTSDKPPARKRTARKPAGAKPAPRKQETGE